MTKIVNMGPLSNWHLCESGKSIDLPGIKRSVRIGLVVAGRAPVAVTDLVSGEMTIIGYVEGMQEFVFGVEGHCQVTVDSEADAYYRTDDGSVTAVEYNNKPFVTAMERRTRNPQLEYLMYLQEQNAEKRSLKLHNAMAAQLARLESLNNEVNSATTGGNSAAAGGGQPADTGGGQKAAEPTGGSTAGTNGAQGPAAGADGDPK